MYLNLKLMLINLLCLTLIKTSETGFFTQKLRINFCKTTLSVKSLYDDDDDDETTKVVAALVFQGVHHPQYD